jgi:hypothetical protein
VFAISLGGLLFGEKIEAGQGFGYDGGEYANIAQHFEALIAEKSLDSYRIQRILPSAIVHYTLRSLEIPFTPPAIIMAFGFLNVAIFTVSSAVWCQIANRMHITAYAKLIGFIGLFVNFAVLKMASYYPVLTDNAALMLGLVALYFYLIGSRIGLYVLMVVGAFTWPTVAYACVPLALFPYPRSQSSSVLSEDSDRISSFPRQHGQMNSDDEQEPLSAEGADRWSLPYSYHPVRVLLVLAVLTVLVGLLLGKGRIAHEALILLAATLLLLGWSAIEVRVQIKLPPLHFWLASAVALYVGITAHRIFEADPTWYDTIESLLPLSYAIVACYVFAGLFMLWNSPRLFRPAYWLPGFRVHVLLVIAGLFMGSSVVKSWLSGVEMSAQFVFRNIILSAIQAPGIFLVAHVVYFGPIVVVALLYWRQASELIRDYGGGLLLITSLALLFSLMSESRTIINFFPIFVMVSVGALDKQGDLSGKKVLLFALLSLFMSRIWLQISDNHDLYYFMNFGPWMGRRIYYIFLVITVLATGLVYMLFKYRSGERALVEQEVP